jgi:nucleoside-diphosphate-sugar epimerase
VSGTVLVAGGAGYLASALIERLAAGGFTIFAADVFDSPGDLTTIRRSRAGSLLFRNLARIEEMDLSVLPAVEDLFLRSNPEIVVNLTPLGLPQSPPLSPLLWTARRTCRHFIQASCLRAREEGNGWRTVEDEVEKSGLEYTILRLADLCGEGLAGTRFPASMLEALHAGHGIEVEDGPARDYVEPRDAAAAIVSAINAGPRKDKLDIGTGEARTPGAIVRLLGRSMGREPALHVKLKGRATPPVIADLEKARKALNFYASSSIEEMVTSIVSPYPPTAFESTRSRPAAAKPTAEGESQDEPLRISRRDLFGFLRRPR